jgi:hypothetical protein
MNDNDDIITAGVAQLGHDNLHFQWDIYGGGEIRCQCGEILIGATQAQAGEWGTDPAPDSFQARVENLHLEHIKAIVQAVKEGRAGFRNNVSDSPDLIIRGTAEVTEP